MLDLIRKKKKSGVVKLIFWAIIATFVGTIFLVWGKGRDDGGPDTTAVTVNGTELSHNDYQTIYSNLFRFYQNLYRDQFSPALEKQLGLRQQAVDALIEQALLAEEADRLNLKVTKQELVEAIAGISAFQTNGVFDKDRYLQVLSYQRMVPDQFEAMQKRDLLLEKVRNHYRRGVTLSDQDVLDEFRSQNEKVTLSFLRLAPAAFAGRVAVDEKGLQEFFNENAESFRIPEKIALKYVVFDPARFEKGLTFEEVELEKYYRRNLDSFEIPEQVKASHVLIKVAEDADADSRAKKRALAQKVLDEARAGKDFADLARTHSDDPGSRASGGSLGFFGRGAMVAPFEAAAFALKPGEYSEVVESPFGFHVIRSEGYIEAGVKPLEDVLDEVRAGLTKEKSAKVAYENAMDAYNINRKDGSIEAAAKENDLGLKETALFSRTDAIDGLGDLPGLKPAAFLLKEGELGRPLSTPIGVILFSVAKREESRLPQLVQVRAQVEAAFREARSESLAKQSAEEILASAKEGKSLQELARDNDLKLEETDQFTRSFGTFIPRIGAVAGLAESAFGLTSKAPVAPEVYTVEGKFVVASLKERVEADPAEFTEVKREQLGKSLLMRKQEEQLNARVQQLREEATIAISPALMKAIGE